MKVFYLKVTKTAGTTIASLINKYSNVKIIRPVADEIRLWDFNKNTWVFTVVRNPWDRAVSSWKWTCSHRMKFKEFLEIPFGKMKATMEQHSKPQYDLLQKNNSIDYIDYVGRFEELDKVIEIVFEKLGKKIPNEIPYHRKTDHKHYTEYYDEELIELVANKYKKDIETFDYRFGDNEI